MPGYGGCSRASRRRDLEFEAATYRLLGTVAGIPSSRLLYYRHCEQSDGPSSEVPKDIKGRALVVFELTEGRKSLWAELDEDQKVIVQDRTSPSRLRFLTHLLLELSLLSQAAAIRAAMLNLELPADLASSRMPWRTSQPEALTPEQLATPISASRELCVSMFTAQVEAVVRAGEGGVVGREEGHRAAAAGPKALAAKHAILRLIPHMLPEDEGGDLYRLVLQHDDYGIHNMSILPLAADGLGRGGKGARVSITSVFDWEAARVVPVLLSEVDLLVHGRLLAADDEGRPAWRMWDPSGGPGRPEWHARNQAHAGHYLEVGA